jgi:ferrous iron transport protein B
LSGSDPRPFANSAALADPCRFTVALLGNPNTGKTTLFNRLSGMRQRVGNYPGVTVEKKTGVFKHRGCSIEIIDLPGTYSLAARSPDEFLAVDVILGHQPGAPRPDVVVSIVDASNIERNLYLTTQAFELGVPVVVALNMVDIAERHGTRVDLDRLQERLGVSVVPIQANKGVGLARLKDVLVERVLDSVPGKGQNPTAPDLSTDAPRGPCFPDAFEREVNALRDSLGNGTPTFLVRRLLLDVGGYTETRLAASGHTDVGPLVRAGRERLAREGCRVPEIEARTRYGWIHSVTSACVERVARRGVTWTDRIDRILLHRLFGTLIFLTLMFVVFQSIFTWARPAMDAIDHGRQLLGDAVERRLEPGPFRALLSDGVIKGVGSVLVFLPQILILFGFIAVLEDCGYMARAAFLMDKLMARCGLSGKSFIPLLSSVACAVPGIMATRVIENRRDRMATILVAPLMSCSARLPVYTLLIGAFLTEGFGWWVPGLTMFGLYAIGLIAAPLVAWLLKTTLLRGETPIFLMEMPLYKWPSVHTVARRVVDSGWAFLRRAGTLIFASMILVWALLYFPNTDEQGLSYESRVGAEENRIAAYQSELTGNDADAPIRKKIEASEEEINRLQAAWKSRSILGRAGRAIEPVVRPLGWDWRIGMAALASFPAREVVVGTLGIIYGTGEGSGAEPSDNEEGGSERKPGHLGTALREATWEDHPGGTRIFTVPVALSLMVFFALCCQCASTLAVIGRETHSWRWPIFTFMYMTLLAYGAALVVYQVGIRLI